MEPDASEHAVSLKSDTRGSLDFDLSASTYNYLEDIQFNPFTVGAGATYSQNAKITRNDGTNWQNADAKLIDNVFNEQYFLFHPFPGRTYVLAGRDKF